MLDQGLGCADERDGALLIAAQMLGSVVHALHCLDLAFEGADELCRCLLAVSALAP